jgi:hypothetical protein
MLTTVLTVWCAVSLVLAPLVGRAMRMSRETAPRPLAVPGRPRMELA